MYKLFRFKNRQGNWFLAELHVNGKIILNLCFIECLTTLSYNSDYTELNYDE
jgi:hypothetical protein